MDENSNPIDARRNPWFVIFLLSPIISLYIALKNFRLPSSKNVVWLFTAYFGFTLVISNSEFDLVRYKEDFENYYVYGGSYVEFFKFLFSADTTQADIFIPLVGFTVYKFTDNFVVYLTLVGVLYGYIYSRNIWYIIDRINGKVLTNTFIYIAVFAFLFPIWRGINGPRFSIGVHIYFFGMCKYIIDNKKYGLFIASLSVLSHFSLAIAVVVAWIFAIFGNRMHIYFILYAISLFFREINVSGLNDIAEKLPAVFSKRVNDYTNEDYAREITEAAATVNWYAQYYILMLRWTASGIILLMYFKAQEYFKQNKAQADLFSFTLLFLVLANIMSLVPSGDRFLSFAYLFVYSLYAWFTNNYKDPDSTFFAFNKFAQYSLVLFFIVEIRIGFDFIGMATVFGNPFAASFIDSDKAIITLIK